MINKPDEDKKVTTANELSDDDMNAVSGGLRGLGPREPFRPRPPTDANPKLPNQPENPPRGAAGDEVVEFI